MRNVLIWLTWQHYSSDKDLCHKSQSPNFTVMENGIILFPTIFKRLKNESIRKLSYPVSLLLLLLLFLYLPAEFQNAYFKRYFNAPQSIPRKILLYDYYWISKGDGCTSTYGQASELDSLSLSQVKRREAEVHWLLFSLFLSQAPQKSESGTLRLKLPESNAIFYAMRKHDIKNTVKPCWHEIKTGTFSAPIWVHYQLQ